ncbi:MAG: hypothetical protein WA126_08670 [Thermodesulfovibrionales bacterium]
MLITIGNRDTNNKIMKKDSRQTEMTKRVVLLIALVGFALLLCCSAALSEAFKLPDTGQTKCYQGVSPYAEIPCAGTGQDGAYNINPLSAHLGFSWIYTIYSGLSILNSWTKKFFIQRYWESSRPGL